MTNKEFYRMITDSVQEKRKEISRASAKVRDLENSRKNYTAEYVAETLNPQIRALQGEIQAMRDEGKRIVSGMCDSYREELVKQDQLDPEKITADINLLNAGITLNADDLRTMIDRNNGNRTMQQLILRYAADHKIETGLQYNGNSGLIAMLGSVPYAAEVSLKWAEADHVYNQLLGAESAVGSTFG